MKKILLLTVFALFLSCATQPSQNIPQSFSAKSNEGMIIGSIAFENEKPIFNSYTFLYSGPGKKNYISIHPEQTIKWKFKPDFFDNNKAVYLFSISGIPGNYEFTILKFFENGGFVTYNLTAPINVSFEIEKGKVKYLGEIYVNYNQQIIQLNDQKERDLPKINEMFPYLKVE